jgi:precorrin-6B methylase 2
MRSLPPFGRAAALAFALLVVASVGPAQADKETKQAENRQQFDVPFVPTPHEVVDKMLELAKPKKKDIVYDLGCGDGRIVVAAAKKYGCKAYGFDLDPQRIKESKALVKEKGVGKLVTIEKKDLFKVDLSKANVVTLYLLPDVNKKLIPQLKKMKKGSRIVSHDFMIEGVKPDKTVNVRVDGRDHTVYLFTTPLNFEKETRD